MSALRSAFDVITAQQDFLWFCTLLAWIAAGAFGFLHRRNDLIKSRRAWLVTVCASGALLAGGELVMHSIPAEPIYDPRMGWDFALSLLQAVQSLAAILLLPGAARRRGQTLVLGGGLLVLWSARLDHFAAVSSGLWLAAVVVAAMATVEKPWRVVLALLALAPLLATTGVPAELLGYPRRWVDLSAFALPSAVWQQLCALMLIRQVAAACGWLPRSGRGAPLPVELRGFIRVTAVWLLLGLALAVGVGRVARAAFEQSLLSRIRAAAALIDPRIVAPVVAAGLTLKNADSVPQPSGTRSPIAHVPGLVKAARPLRHRLADIERFNPDVYWALFQTLCEGHLITAVRSGHLPAHPDIVSDRGPATALDRAAWVDGRVHLEQPFMNDIGQLVRVRAPIILADGTMLGWLVFELGAQRWTAAQSVARLQSFALIGVGVILALFIALRRLDQLEQERAEREALAALEADRAKTAFLAKVSHELRTPVQSILGYGELLSGLTLAPEAGRWLGAVRTQGQLLIRLVNDLLDLSALQAGAFRLAPAPGNLGEIVRTATESLVPRAAAKGLGLRAEIAADLPPCLAFDPERIRQVLLNLVGNAIKFTDRGEIRVRLTVTGAAGTDPLALALAVHDTGPGIAPEDQARLFRPFSRLQDHVAIEGAGLGLALSAALCQSMGGGLGVESDGAHGSTFIARLALPLATPVPAPVAAAAPVELAGLRVLVADDNPLVRELFSTSLRLAGAWVDAATDGLEAVELCAREKYAVVVLDLSMPWLNGMEAARRIRAVAPGSLRIVGVSAHAGGTDRELALAAGMDLLLTKPLPMTDLLAAVAGHAVVDRTTPSGGSPDNLVLLRRLRRQFVDEAPRLQSELQQALDASDRRWLRARAHYLKNSADVAGFPEISLLCAGLEQRVQEPAGDVAPDVAELVRLLRLIHATLSPENPSGINPTSTPR